MSAEYIGPFENYYEVTVDGYKVPRIKANKVHNGDGDEWDLLLDDRFSIIATGEEIEKWLWIVANAMAIGAGYSCFGENSVKINEYKCAIHGIRLDDLEDE